ncbi:kinase-like protein [Rhizophagus irregularis]|uniref:Kinase-like protein n=1 Tax=Rhizophagus irregularis TaxID=588596 RepID=A0A2N1NST0_9GLOM|nr:kinase-like protein [Rhizophagus irregularis]
MQNNENVDDWINWIEEAISKKHNKYYEFEIFKNIQEIGSGAFGKVFRANWKNFDNYLALKSFYNLNKITLKEIVHENNFYILTWDNKYSLAYQLACSILCLHDEGIIHRDLHSCNVLVHQNSIKLADFGLSKRIDEASNSQSRVLGKVPYIDPKAITDNLKLNEKSDVYSIGVLLWEISSGKPPFHEENYDLSLMYKISKGQREEIISDTPNDYSDLYTECWNGDQNKRPSIHEVVNRLRISLSLSSATIYQQDIFNQIIPTSNESLIPNSIENSLHGELSQIIQNFNNTNANEIYMMSTNNQIKINISSEKNLSIIANEIVDLIFREENRKDESKQHVLDYLNNHNINSEEIYNWLSYNQTNSYSIFLLGYFNYFGIGTPADDGRALNLFINASVQNHILAQYYVGKCYEFGHGMITKDEKLAFVYYEKIANEDYAMGQYQLGCFYTFGRCVIKDFKKASNWHKKAANNGHLAAMLCLGLIYILGKGVDEDHQKAFELFKKSVEGEYPGGITMLGNCYNYGIGISIDKEKAIELYQKAANLGDEIGQHNLTIMYENGNGIEKDIEKAIYWYEQSAKQGFQNAQNKLEILKKS